jgi:murein DD-endopeptidase MepM/ murein hydrolase activator NlpD
MKNIFLPLFFLMLLSISCGSAATRLFSKKSPHEKYAEKLDDKDLDKTPAGRQWLAASRQALEEPQIIDLPYKHKGIFAGDKQRALGLKFSPLRGQKLTFTITMNNTLGVALYADLFKLNVNDPLLLLSADTSVATFSVDIEEQGSYVLRLQPELFRKGEYSLSITTGPSLLFPVGGKNAKTGSFWGAGRDGGKRSHEGIDIFAPKNTPAIAAADGIITGVGEGGLGGKVVWLRPLDKNVTLYYAHLDKQLVHEGQVVKKGEAVGLVGNTGNAKHTPSHLHFGVYSSSGPVDPFPFVNLAVKSGAAVPDKKLNTYLQLLKTQKLGNEVANVNTLLIPLAVTGKGYISELPNGRQLQVVFAAVKILTQPVKQTEAIAIKSKQETSGKNSL